MPKCRIPCPAASALSVLSPCPTSLSLLAWCASQSLLLRLTLKRVRLVAVSDRLSASLAFCRRPVNMQLVTTDGQVPTRSNSFAICTVFDPSDESKVIRRYKGPDTIRQFQAWKGALLGFPLLIQSHFCGTVVAARRVDSKGVCHVC